MQNINIIKKDTEIQLEVVREAGLEIEPEESE
jgi:hypothetical protein